MKHIPLTKGMVAFVDDADWAWLSTMTWCAATSGAKTVKPKSVYAKTKIGRTWPLMHRMIMCALPGQEVDHINGNTLDNRRANLRLCSRLENSRNTDKKAGRRTSRFKGVVLFRNGRWHARITAPGVPIHIGYFATEREAALAYDAKARELFGEFARLNFPHEGVA